MSRIEERTLTEEVAPPLPHWLRALPFVLGTIALVIAAAALAGWAFDQPSLYRVFSSLPAAVPISALVLAVQGSSVLCLGLARRTGRARWARIGRILALATSCVTLLVLLEYIAGFDTGLDTLFFREKVLRAADRAYAGRMSPNTAIAAGLTALALAQATRDTPRSRSSMLPIAMVANLVVTLSLVGIVYNITDFFGLNPQVGMGLPSAAALLCIGVSCIALTPERGIVVLIVRQGSLRKLLFAPILAPLGLALVVRLGELAGLYNLDFAFALCILLTIGLFSTLIISGAQSALFAEEERIKLAAEEAARAEVTAERDKARQLAEALGQSQAKLQAIVDHAPAAIYIKDNEGRLVLVNRYVEKTLGKPREEILGATERELLPEKLADGLRASDARVLAEDKPVEIEEVLPHEDGPHTYQTVKFPLPGLDGRPAFIAGISTDITEKRRDAERKEFLLRLHAELLPVAEPKRLVRMAITRLGERMGVTRAGLMLVDSKAQEIVVLPEYHHGAPPGGFGRFPLAVFSKGLGPLAAGETLVVDDTRTDPRTAEDYETLHAPVDVAASIVVPLLRGGAWVAFVYTHRDKPHTWTADEVELVRSVAHIVWPLYENARLLELAQDAVRVRDEFLSIASHELRTPLTPLSLRLDSLARTTNKQPDSDYVRAVKSYVETTRRQVQRLAVLITDLLDASRIQAGKLSLQREEVDLVHVAREVADRFEPEATRVKSELVVDAPPSLVGSWDRLRLEQVVDNLLSNALKYGPGEPVSVRIGATDGLATLVVEDHGIGVPPEAQARIFERFERAVSERNYGGLGLGLHIVRNIVEAHGGTITVESAAGKGAMFTVRLPFRA
jgi:PAS domain S-box-containing protein